MRYPCKGGGAVQSLLAYSKLPPPYDHRRALGMVPSVGLSGGVVSFERDTPVGVGGGGRPSRLGAPAHPCWEMKTPFRYLRSEFCGMVISLGTRGSRAERPHTRGTSLRGVPRDQKMLKGHLSRVMYHQVSSEESILWQGRAVSMMR